MIKVRKAIREYDEATNESEREKALEDIKKFCFWSNVHEKPANLKKIKKS